MQVISANELHFILYLRNLLDSSQNLNGSLRHYKPVCDYESREFYIFNRKEKSPTQCLSSVGLKLFLSSPTQMALKHSDVQRSVLGPLLTPEIASKSSEVSAF